ncbi:MAG: ribonuclease III domain-containing protein [Bacillota bacterium]|nr:ribonuclease III domain-containing protein [Bacillota bacterium]
MLQTTSKDGASCAPSNLSLAYIGDAVYELLVREYLITNYGLPSAQLHKMATSIVNAKSQSDAVEKILPLLSDEEERVYMRGRNAKLSPVKRSSPVTHCRATGLEALFGYLYLNGNQSRMNELIGIILDHTNTEIQKAGGELIE